MYSSFSPRLTRPNLPLRKPSSTPVTLCASPLAKHITEPDDLSPAKGAIANGPINLSAIKDASVVGSMPQALTVYYCNFCGQQGNFRCKRCKKTPYCSVQCQTEDWKAHRHMCKAINPQPVKKTPTKTTVSDVMGNGFSLLEAKLGDVSGYQRVYLKDLHITKVNKGTEIQASLVEFHSPGRFFLLAQSSEVMEALQTISTELQKTYSCLPVMTYVPCIGEVCAVQFSHDMKWYRGLVQSLASDQKTAHTLYIDFGNEETVPVDRIKPLAANIQPLFPCAMECCIAGVFPVAGNWSEECCIAVRQLLAGKTLRVNLVETLEHSCIHAVDILFSMGTRLSTFLIKHGYATEKICVTPTEQDIDNLVNASLENFRCLSDGKDDNTWAQPPEPLTLAEGESLSVVVTHLQSPTEIIVQKVENARMIQTLQAKLREHCSQVSAPQNFRPAPGTVCCAQFSEDKLWYRAEVLAYSSKECVCVGYIDFGNSEVVDLSHLRPLSSSLLAVPKQTIRCGLAGVQPVGERWTEDCVLALQRRISNRILRIEIQGVHEGKALVAMIDEASDPQANIAELLCSAGFSVPAVVATRTEQQTDQEATATAELQAPTPAWEPLLWSCAELPCDGQTVALLASVVESPQKFYCHIDNPAGRQQLMELEAELKRHCVVNASPVVPKVGEPCCAMFPDDGEWYRVMVTGLSEHHVSVNFVDRGHSMTVEKKHLRSITPQLLALPFQAIRCSLAGVEPLGSEWSRDALLCFQNVLRDGQLSARVLSVSEQGYGVKLESRGQDVAAALISEQLAKAPGAALEERHATPDSKATHPEQIKEDEHSLMRVQASSVTGASSGGTLTEGSTLMSEAPSFPVDWKTVELPPNETFQPCFAAVISPSLFYLLGPSQVDRQKLQEVMMELAAYCSNSSPLPSSALSRPAPGAACCAQFSADNMWYRAVVLEAGENDLRIIYADYGNTEKVPFSRILPIPTHLLQLPFQIARCTLAGKEHFPAEWPEEVLQTFQSLLLKGVLATVQSFDGFANVLSLSLHTESGGGQLTAVILDALYTQAKRDPPPSTTQEAEQSDGSLSAATTTVTPHCLQPMAMPETHRGLEDTPAPSGQTVSPESALWTPQQKKNTAAGTVNGHPALKIVEQMEPPCVISKKTDDPQDVKCCCLDLMTKIDRLEQLDQLLLSLVQQLLRNKS